MNNRFAYLSAGLLLVAGVALADADGDLTNPSTTGTEAMDAPSSQVEAAEPAGQNGVDRVSASEAEDMDVGTMGAGNRGTTGGMGATTGTGSMNEKLDDEQREE